MNFHAITPPKDSNGTAGNLRAVRGIDPVHTIRPNCANLATLHEGFEIGNLPKHDIHDFRQTKWILDNHFSEIPGDLFLVRWVYNHRTSKPVRLS